jgi:DNA repair photolyase
LAGLQVREVRCKTLLHDLDYGGGTEYTANFYKGCSHGCVYCYVPSLTHDERRWGTYVDVKVNAPEILDRELRGAEPKVVFLSSASDSYQPVEARYKVTRRCLEVLLKHGFPVSILTRSPLILRDLDLLTKFEWIRVGFSISTACDRRYEPGVVPVERRIECLRKLSSRGIRTWVSMAPIIPRLILTDIEALVGKLRDAGVSMVTPGLLRFQWYEESRRMFEGVTGEAWTNFLEDSGPTLERIRGLIKTYGLDDSSDFFMCESRGRDCRIDSFVS